MANTNRRRGFINQDGKMFVPMNVEGNYWSDNFFTTKKTITLAIIVASLAILILYMGSNEALTGSSKFLLVVLWGIASLYATRFIIFEERFYYKMYKEMKKSSITYPDKFWEIASINDTKEGAIMTYRDAKIAVMVKLDKGTIIGREQGFREEHYDAISDAFHKVVDYKYSLVDMNLMEIGSTDERLINLTEEATKNNNENLNKLMELMIGHLNLISHSNMCENDYILFYTKDISKVDKIINEVNDIMCTMLNGAYDSYTILDKQEISDRAKENSNVKYFNITKATLNVYEGNSIIESPFKVTGIRWINGENQELNNQEKNKLRSITSGKIKGQEKYKNVSLKRALYREDSNKIKYNDLSNV